MKKPPSAQTLAEMERGKQVLAARAEWEHASPLQRVLSARFNPNHMEFYVEDSETAAARPDKHSREYIRRLQEENKDRWGD